MKPGDAVVIDRDGLDQVISGLRTRGYRTIGPVVRDGAVMLGEIRGTAGLPVGWHDTQAPGSYALRHSDDEELFGWAVGPQSMKSEAFPPKSILWRASTEGTAVTIVDHEDEPARTALVGARPCELAAMAVLDRVLAHSPTPDPLYVGRRAGTFVLVADCGSPSGTCFCDSMGTGPAAQEGFDLAVTEVLEGEHRFVVRVGSEEGAEVLAEVPHRDSTEIDAAACSAVVEAAVQQMGRKLDTVGLPQLLARNIDSPHWEVVADRCLACGNCTLVCPTCFCSTVSDTTDLAGTVERTRTWASCFDLQHSYLHGGSVRVSTASRYRQWMTHKLSTWHDQFGTSGCVGCGRCIAWCPVGIDITAEAAAIREADRNGDIEQGGL
ncbi:MAG: 4Fe-4S dicluster domain-containing protein [Acidimicrobiales bacterium]